MIPVDAKSTCQESLLLWRAWFEKGQQGLADKDYPHAVEWLLEALRHIEAKGPNVNRYARTQATLAYAYLRNSQNLEECAADGCMSDAVRCRYLAVAAEHRQQAGQLAECALPSLNESYERARVARGQAEFVLGVLCVRLQQLDAGDKHFERVHDALYHIAALAPLLAEAYIEAFNVAFRVGQHERARFWLDQLEPLLKELPKTRPENISWLLACKAAVLLHLGHYQQADALRQRWQAANRRCAKGYDCTLHCAQALCVFGRARMFMGYFDEAAHDLERSQSINERLEKPDCLLEFDVLLARGELNLRLAYYGCARQLLGRAEPLLAELEKTYCAYLRERHVRLCLAKADYHLALGELMLAGACYEGAKHRAEQECHGRYHQLVPALLGIARVHALGSRIPQSLACVRSALACLEQAKATLTAEMGQALHELAFAYLQDNKPDEAEPVCELALKTLAIALRGDHPDSAFILITLAQSLSSQHKAEPALEALDLAEQRLHSAAPCDLFSMARLLYARAHVLHARRSIACAMNVIRCAINLWLEQERRIQCEVFVPLHPHPPHPLPAHSHPAQPQPANLKPRQPQPAQPQSTTRLAAYQQPAQQQPESLPLPQPLPDPPASEILPAPPPPPIEPEDVNPPPPLPEPAQPQYLRPVYPRPVYQHPEKGLLYLECALLHAHCGESQLALHIFLKCRVRELLWALKCNHQYVGYELNRLANMFFKHKLYVEAAWLYNLAEGQYASACGAHHPFTCAVRERHQEALARLHEPKPHEVCACAPWFVPCPERRKVDLCGFACA